MPKGNDKGRKGKGPKGNNKGRKGKGYANRHVLSEDQPGPSHPVSEGSDSPQHSQPSQPSQTSTASQRKNILKHHVEMVMELSEMFSLKSKDWDSIRFQVEAMEYISPRDMGDLVNSMEDLCKALVKNGVIMLGEYSDLRAILVTRNVKAGDTIDKFTARICQEKTGQPQAKRRKTEYKKRETHPTEFSPKIAAMIERTKAKIEEDKKGPFIVTKGFQDAKEKLNKNGVVVIKGNTGDGKTTAAIRLILSLIEEQQGRQPLQLHNMEDLDLLSPKSKLITFIDDIFGEKVVHEKDVGEWNKRIKSVLPTLCGDKSTEADFLIITIRNEVFNSLKSNSLENVFVDSNIIDLSSNDYKIKKEKLELLELYKPKNDEFSWRENEKEEIVKYATDIGFPQCCRLFRDVPDLQKERVDFFKKPFYILNRVLEKLEEWTAILFLFLNEGRILAKDLDPNGEKVNKTLLDEAFDIDLKGAGVNRRELKYEQKVEFVRKSLDTLSGFLVVKEKVWYGDGFVYRFCHDSINATVELLYRLITPIGYKKFCPKAWNNLPAEILQMDQQSIELYRKCLEEKEEADYSLRVIVIGQTEVGKTTLTRNLLRLPPIIPPATAVSTSTDGVDIHSSFVNLNDQDWITYVTDMQHKPTDARLLQTLKSAASQNTGEDPNTVDGKSGDESSAQISTNTGEYLNAVGGNSGDESSAQISTNTGEDLNAVGGNSGDESSAQPASVSGDANFSPSKFDNDDEQNEGQKNTGVDSVDDSVLKTVRSLDLSQKDPSSDLDYTKLGELSVWDFAGQFVFYTTHHTFLTPRAVYLLVTKLNQDINDPVTNDQCFLDATGCKEMKIKDFVSYWMNSVHLYSDAAENLPPVILVGTHLDKVEGDIEQATKIYFDNLRKFLLDIETPTCRHLIDKDFTVSNPPNEQEIQQLRRKIVELASKQSYWGEKIPAKWITLEKALTEKKNEGVNIMSYDEVVELDKITGVPIDDPEKLDLFLRFQHAKGNMIYFSEGCLRDHIVLNPQWLIDAFKCIITARQFCIKNPCLVKHWEALNKTGKLYLGMVGEIFREEDRFCLHKQHILGLMERLHIISHQKNGDDKSSTSGEFYFVPSLLQDKVTESKIEKFVKGTNRTPYLCYVFKNNFLPPAVFHRLIAACLSKYPVAKQGSQFLMFCGCGIFDLNGGLTRLVVMFYDNIIQIGLFRFSKEGRCAPETSTCVSVREFITETLERVMGRYNMNLPFEPNIKCEKSPLQSCEGLLSLEDLISGGEEVVCSKHEEENHFISRQSHLQHWFPKQVSATDNNQEVDRSGNSFGQSDVIQNEKLRQISSKIGKEFKALACFLGLIEAEIYQIQSNDPHDTREQIYQILLRWKEKSGPHATYQCLEEALRNSEIDVEILSEPEVSGAFKVT